MQYNRIKKPSSSIGCMWCLLKHLYLYLIGYRIVGESYTIFIYRRGENKEERELVKVDSNRYIDYISK